MVGIGGDAEQAERAEFRPQMRAGTRCERSISAASGAILSCAKRRTMSRSASMSSPSAKLSVFVYISFLRGARCPDQAHRHGKIGFGDFADRQPLVRPEPDDDAR